MQLLAVGAPVRIKKTVHTGTLLEYAIHEEGTKVRYLVGFDDHDGEGQQRHFDPDEVEAI